MRTTSLRLGEPLPSLGDYTVTSRVMSESSYPPIVATKKVINRPSDIPQRFANPSNNLVIHLRGVFI